MVNKLKEILTKRNIRQSWLCEKLGMKKATMSNIINNKVDISVNTAVN